MLAKIEGMKTMGFINKVEFDIQMMLNIFWELTGIFRLVGPA